MQKVSQAFISINSFTELNKAQIFPVTIVKGFQYHEGQFLPKGQFTQLDFPFNRICYRTCAQENLPLCWDS